MQYQQLHAAKSQEFLQVSADVLALEELLDRRKQYQRLLHHELVELTPLARRETEERQSEAPASIDNNRVFHSVA